MSQPIPRSTIRRPSLALLGATLILASVTGCASKTPVHGAAKVQQPERAWVSSTPRASGNVKTVDWNLFYEPSSIDPIHALDTTEDEVVSNLCDTLVRMNANGTYSPGLATYSNPNPTTWIYHIHPGVKFWDGKPVTGAEVAYSLNRNLNPSLGSYYSDFFTNVSTIRQTGPLQVTVKLKRPDELFNQVMSLSAGAVTEEAYDKTKGKSLGSASGGIMCSGPYKLVKWVPGQSLTMVANHDYWDKAVKPKVQKVVFSFIAGDSAETNALTSGEIQGMYDTPVSGTSTLQSSKGHLYLGKSLTQFVISPVSTSATNPLQNVAIRQALSLAIDRRQVASNIFNGVAETPASNTLFSEPVYPYAASVFRQAQSSFPSLGEVNLAKAKKLVAGSGYSKRPIKLAYESDGPSYDGEFAQYLQSVGNKIGLVIKLDPLPTSTFNEIGFDKSLDAGIDVMIAYWFNELPDPVQWYSMFATQKGAQFDVYNYAHYQNPIVAKYIRLAQETANPVKRAHYVVAAERQIMHDLPWIPVVDMANRLYLRKGLSGPTAAYNNMWTAWATSLGSVS
jgi:peptide/nickel transport system substrate-binding protein